MTAILPVPTWFVGCGNMAGALVEGWRSANFDLSGAVAIRPSGTPVEGVRTVTSYPDETPAFVMLGFKPQKLHEIAPELARSVGPETIVVSMLAGVGAASLRARFPDAKAILRIMPNLPVADIGTATLPATEKAIEFMRYIRKAIEDGTFVRQV